MNRFFKCRRLRGAATAGDPDGWQPINTAPKDGTPVDLWVSADGSSSDEIESVKFYCSGLDRFNPKTRRREGRVPGMRYEQRGPNRGWYPVGGLPGMAMVIEPTHWRPVPSAPALSKAESREGQG